MDETSRVRTTVSERMPENMRRGRPAITYLPGRSVGCREDEILARLWGCKPSSAHQRKLRVAAECADVIRVKRDAGATDSLAVWLRPIEDALAHQRPVEGNPELSAARADCAEDDQEAIYRAEPTEGNARLLLRKRAMERQASLDHDRVIAARHGITL